MPFVFADAFGHRFRFETAPGLFSAERVDDGTRLLLEHLPSSPPRSVLDLGCGYGALGLPVAATHPQARVELVDRDALAVDLAARNAAAHGLSNVVAFPSLGLRDVGTREFDWVLCNVPARIGDDAIAYFVAAGASLLREGGELRLVVIRALDDVVRRVADERALPIRRVAEGARHVVFACPRLDVPIADHESLYLLDRVRVGEREFERPHDVNEDREHLQAGIPLLLDYLPRGCSGAALCWRAGYGPVPADLVRRGARVMALDRDLLQLAFVRRNTGAHVSTRLSARLVGEGARLFAGELHASAGLDTLAEELVRSREVLAKGGEALWLCQRKLVEPLKISIDRLGGSILATRGNYAVVRITARRLGTGKP